MSGSVESADPYVRAMLAEVRANAWLKEHCLERLKVQAGYDMRRFQREEAVIRGRTFFPCLRQLYLLSRVPGVKQSNTDQVIDQLALDGNYNRVRLRHYYDTYRGSVLPQPFVRRFLSTTADVAEASVDNILRSLVCMNMICMKPCEIDDAAKAVQIERDLTDCVESWMQMKGEGWING